MKLFSKGLEVLNASLITVLEIKHPKNVLLLFKSHRGDVHFYYKESSWSEKVLYILSALIPVHVWPSCPIFYIKIRQRRDPEFHIRVFPKAIHL